MNEIELAERLKDIFLNFSTKPLLFVGSGLSKRYLNLPDWRTLLENFTQRIDPDDVFLFRSYENKARLIMDNDGLNEHYLLPTIAEIIEKDYESIFFEQQNFEINIKKTYKEAILSGNSPFRLAIVDHLNNVEKFTTFHSNEIENLVRLEEKISNCFTTNYDGFLETIFKDFEIMVGQQDILNKNPGSIGVIYKIHGSVFDVNSMILTKNDYIHFEEKLKYLSAKLLTHFLEFPIIFIGYGIGDSNIRQILRDIKICLTPENAENLSHRLLFVDYVDSSEKQDIVSTEIEGIRMTKILLKDYNILYKAFDSIVDTIDIKTLRQVESKITQLVQSTNFSVDRVYATGLENEELKNEDLAIYIGHNSSVFNLGYEGIRLINICEDVLFSTKSYDSKGILESTILQQKTFFSRSKVPVYKYLKDYDGVLDPFYETNNIIINELDDIYNKQDRKSRLYLHPIADLSVIIGADQPLKKKIDNIYYSLRALSISEVKSYLRTIWSRKNELTALSHLTKIICVIDLHENK